MTIRERIERLERETLSPHAALSANSRGREVEEPYCDVYDEGEHVKLVFDIPGVEKDDVKVKSAGRLVTIDAERGERSYHREVEAPANVSEKPERAQYKNGVLELIYKKSGEPEDIRVD